MNTPAPSGRDSDVYTDDLAPSDSQTADVYAPSTAEVLARFPSSDVAAGIYSAPPTDGSEHPAIHGLPFWIPSWLPLPSGIRGNL